MWMHGTPVYPCVGQHGRLMLWYAHVNETCVISTTQIVELYKYWDLYVLLDQLLPDGKCI